MASKFFALSRLSPSHSGRWIKSAIYCGVTLPRRSAARCGRIWKLVDHRELAANDWSLTPGRYVGVAPEEVDEGFDFEELGI